MIIDYNQTSDGLSISYVDSNNSISIENLILNNGYYKYIECDKSDPNIMSDLIGFKGNCIKTVPAKYFSHHNINEFFNQDIPKNYPEIYEKLNKIAEPQPFSIDIEVIPTQENGYSNQKETKNPVTSISITDYDLNTIVFCTKHSKFSKLNDLDKGFIDNFLQETLKEHYNEYEFNYDVRFFETEYEMLSTFFECVLNYFHFQIGWNILDYDWQYMFNRAIMIGIDPKKCSPIRKLSKKSIEINSKTRIELQVPTHRIITCYMQLFKDSLIYNNLGSYSLDSVADLILGVKKVSYVGNLRHLYEEDFLKFISYALVDTILVMLLHRKTNLSTVEFFQSFYTGVPYQRLSQNSISEALVYKELRKDNIFLLESEKNPQYGRKYQGGYVKDPVRKIIDAMMGLDYGGLYPNSMITTGTSPEAKIDFIKMKGKTILNKEGEPIFISDGMPLNEIENAKWLKYKEMGYCLAPMGRVYDVTKEYLYTRIEKNLLGERKVFRQHEDDIYLNIIPKIEKELEKRKNNL